MAPSILIHFQAAHKSQGEARPKLGAWDILSQPSTQLQESSPLPPQGAQ